MSLCSGLAESTVSKSRRRNFTAEKIYQRSRWNISHRWLMVRDGQTLCCFVLRFCEPCELCFWFLLPHFPSPHAIPQNERSAIFFFPLISICINAAMVFPLRQVLSTVLYVSNFCIFFFFFFLNTCILIIFSSQYESRIWERDLSHSQKQQLIIYTILWFRTHHLIYIIWFFL